MGKPVKLPGVRRHRRLAHVGFILRLGTKNELLCLNPDGPRSLLPMGDLHFQSRMRDSTGAEDDFCEAHVGDDCRPRSPEGGPITACILGRAAKSHVHPARL